MQINVLIGPKEQEEQRREASSLRQTAFIHRHIATVHRTPVLDQEVSDGIVGAGGVCDVAVFQQEHKAVVVIVLHGDADVQGRAERQADWAGGERHTVVRHLVQSHRSSGGFT